MEITTIATQPFEKLCLDIVGPLPLTEKGNKFILTMQDELTKYSFAIPIPNHESETIANSLLEIITMFGIPKSILIDQGTDFNSNLIKNLTKLFSIKHLITTAYHPQTNGALERSHSTLKDYLRHYINDEQTDWDDYLKFAMFTYNTSIQNSTKMIPYELMFGYKPIMPNTLKNEPEFKYTYETYSDQLKYKLNKAHQIARENLIISKEKSKETYDKTTTCKEFALNDQVMLRNEEQRRGLSKKLQSDWKGPYKVIKVHSNNNASITMSNKTLRVHFNRLKPYRSISDASVHSEH